MTGDRSLWTGPCASALRDRALHRPVDPRAVWIAPSPLARDQAMQGLTLRRGLLARPRVLTWNDLWIEIAGQSPQAPALLGEGALAAIVDDAILRARRADRLRLTLPVANTRGFRRGLAARFLAWTRDGRIPSRDRDDFGSEGEAEEWAVFRAYREILEGLDAEDCEGLAQWASRRLQHDPPRAWAEVGSLVLLDPLSPTRSTWRAIQTFHERAGALLVTLPWEASEPRSTAYEATAKLRERFLGWGFVECAVSADDDRPAGLRGLERNLFRESTTPPSLSDAEGLAVLSAPKGEGLALLVASRVRECLSAGAAPDQVLIVVPRIDEDTACLRRTLEAWGMPVSCGGSTTVAADPAVAALLLAMSLPAEDWESSRLARLLRSGQVRPAWPDLDDALGRATAAAAFRELRVFRDRTALRQSLTRLLTSGPALEEADARKRRRKERSALGARLALEALERLEATLGPADDPEPWSRRVDRVRSLHADLGIDASPAVDLLFDELDCYGDALERLGRGPATISWRDFARTAAALARSLAPPAAGARPDAVRIATVPEAEGARARHVILSNLEEGTFPETAAIEGRDGAEEGSDEQRRAIAREMLRFLRIVGSAGRSLALGVPTVDEKGVALNPAGFVGEVKRCLGPELWGSINCDLPMLKPVLPPVLAVAPRDARTRAVSLAARGETWDDLADLRTAARVASHRPVLEATAAALRMAHHRLRRKTFGRFEGMLESTEAKGRLHTLFGPSWTAWSPSQLESLAFCPFQFAMRYALGLEPIEERGELDEDWAGAGSMIHRALEELHLVLRDDPDETRSPLDRAREALPAVIGKILGDRPQAVSDVHAGLLRIEADQLLAAARRYLKQYEAYLESYPDAACRHVEVTFGTELNPEHPYLELGRPPDVVRIRGTIDRIDVSERDGQALFRVIDYKSRSAPGPKEVDDGVALQLPLYALAVERVILGGRDAIPQDVGYWSLKKSGYKGAKVMAELKADELKVREDWPAFREQMEAFVLALVDRARGGQFPVRPYDEECTARCDYQVVCRIRQMRRVAKTWADAPEIGSGA